MTEIESWQLSPRVIITKGSVIRISGGGPEYKMDDGQIHRMTLPGQFTVLRILKKKRSTRRWLEVRGLNKTAGTYIIFVDGRPYSNLGITWKPYRIKRVRLK